MNDTQLQAVMALLIVSIVALVRKVRPAWFAALPDQLRFAPALVLGVTLESLHKGLDGAGIADAIVGSLDSGGALGLTSIALAHTIKRFLPRDVLTSGAVMIATLACTGCAGSFEEARGTIRFGAPKLDAYCRSLDNSHRVWGATAKTAGVLAAGVGAAPFALGDIHEQRIAAGAAMAFGATAAGAVFLSESAAESWARECAR